MLFQSTRPSRGATGTERRHYAGRQHFNPRAPRGARLFAARASVCSLVFQSTRPSRGATTSVLSLAVTAKISIHAPLAGRDDLSIEPDLLVHYFNPRAPRGARHGCTYHILRPEAISIHAPLAGRDDQPAERHCRAAAHFNPRAPRGARPCMSLVSGYCSRFQSTRPSRGATKSVGCVV